jgi:hypothetical protein
MKAKRQPEQESIPIPIPIPISINSINSINSISSISSISPTPIQKIIGLIGNHCLEATPEGAHLVAQPLSTRPNVMLRHSNRERYSFKATALL